MLPKKKKKTGEVEFVLSESVTTKTERYTEI